MPHINANGISLYYEIHGDGQPLVLIEGRGAAVSWIWFRQVTPLSAEHRLLIYDNRGAGKSQKPEVDYTLQDMADDLLDLLDALGIEKTSVLGISMGGMIAQEFAIDYPDRVEKLILSSTHYGGSGILEASEEAVKAMMPDTSLPPAERIRKTMAAGFAPGWVDAHSEMVEAIVSMRLDAIQPAEASMRERRAREGFDASQRLARIKAPTLILHGDADSIVPVGNVYLIAQKMPGAAVHIFPGGGHMVHIEHAEIFNRVVLDFLS